MKKEETAKRKEAKAQEKEERKRLNKEGLCPGSDREIYTHAEVGEKFRRVSLEDMKKEEKS